MAVGGLTWRQVALAGLLALPLGVGVAAVPADARQGEGNDRGSFHLEEATIADIQTAVLRRQVTVTDVVKGYLARIKAYNGTCVEEPQGILGPITPIPHAGQVNALMTLNLRPATRAALGFDARKSRSMTDSADNAGSMPDALEVAAAEDAYFKRTGRLIGPLHGAVFSVKDMLDTKDMRTTSGADAAYANDRPPHDATVVQRVRAAGGIILAKANMGEYASGSRSAFGGTMCNPYATDRDVGGSSGGSAASVATNMVTCSLGEEGGPSIRMPSRFNSVVGLSQSQGLNSRYGSLNGEGLNDRQGGICKTVADVAKVLDVTAGYDPNDELTTLGIGRKPASYVPPGPADESKPLSGMRIGVVREYMNKSLFTEADAQSIDIVSAAVDDLRDLGATIVDPGPEGALFQSCIDKYAPVSRNSLYVRQFPNLFPAGSDQISGLLTRLFNPSNVPGAPTIRNFGPAGGGTGETKYKINRYLVERGDGNIKTLTDLIDKSKFYTDDFVTNNRFRNVKATLTSANAATTYDMSGRIFDRYSIQEIVSQCMATMDLDAVTYPTGNIPPSVTKAPVEPDKNDRSHQAWNLLGQQGFPAITVPAGFTTQVFDRVADPAQPQGRLVGPIPAKLPVGIDFLGLPFDEATILKIAAAYQDSTDHRIPPPDFGPLPKS
jgi:Asp-tRNA(Asn)/Glu-tRNA(Gln) amidotransferase A subunit family amidase